MDASCFDLLDRHVVAGHADAPALRDGTRTWSYARLLEEVSAFGGVLRHCGVAPGDAVRLALPDSAESVVALLACGRIGAAPTASGEVGVLVADSTEVEALRDATAAVVLVRQRPGTPWELREGRDYDWDVVMRAGRTDPAPCVEGATLTPSDARTGRWLETLLAGGTVEL